jgi:hypothetical protein
MPSKRGRHNSIPPDLKRSVAWLDGLASVRRLILGPTRRVGHHFKVGTIRVRRVLPAGLDVLAYAGGRIVTVFIATEPGEAVAVAGRIRERFPAGVDEGRPGKRRSPFDWARRDD